MRWVGRSTSVGWHGSCYRQWGVGPAIGKRDAMHIDIVMLNIVIALGIIGLIARAADGGK